MNVEEGDGLIDLSDLIHRAVDKSYEDLHLLTKSFSKAGTSSSLSDEDRRSGLLTYLQESRKRFMQLLVLVKWSVQSPLVQQCGQLLSKSHSFDNQLNETNDRLFFMHADLNRAKERVYDISTAVDILFDGTYKRLPTIIENAMMPRELPPVDVEGTIEELEELLRFRMLETTIPSQFTLVTIEKGILRCVVPGEFEICLTLLGRDYDAQWKVVTITTMLDSKNQDSSSSSYNDTVRAIDSVSPTEEHYRHLRNVVQRKLHDSKAPLTDAFTIIHDFCSSLALEVLYAQAMALKDGRWKNGIDVVFNREEQSMDICYWKNGNLRALLLTSSSTLFSDDDNSSSSSFPSNCFCVRIVIDTNGSNLLKPALFPDLPHEVSHRNELLNTLILPSNLRELSAERIILSAMRAHASVALFSLSQRIMTTTTKTKSKKVEGKLVTGEPIEIDFTSSSFHIRRTDIEGLTSTINIGVDLRSGTFVANSDQLSGQSSLKNLQSLLQSQSSSSSTTGKTIQAIQSNMSEALKSLFIYDIGQVGRGCLGVEAETSLPLDWTKFLEYQLKNGADQYGLDIEKGSMYFPIMSNSDFVFYMVVEVDRCAGTSDNNRLERNFDQVMSNESWIRNPNVALIQATKRIQYTSSMSAVQYFYRLPAIRRSSLSRSGSLKRRLQSNDGHSVLQSFLLHAFSSCGRKVQHQHFLAEAKRSKMVVTCVGEGGTAGGEGTGGQVIDLRLPAGYSLAPLEVEKVKAHLIHGGGLEIRVIPSKLPFTVIRNESSTTTLSSNHCVLSDNNTILFRYVSKKRQWYDRVLMEKSINLFLRDLYQEVRILCKFATELEEYLKPLGLFGKPKDNVVGAGFYVESATPFEIVLASTCCNPRGTAVATGGTNSGEVTYRVSITYQKQKFCLKFSNDTFSNSLMTYIQDSFNVHESPKLLLEVLNNTTVPLGILSAVVESKLISAQYHRPEGDSAEKAGLMEVADRAASSKAGGKGMKLGYKGNIGGKGMRLGYTSDKIIGAEDAQLCPSKLLLIPRGENRLKLVYSNRTSVDIWFKSNAMVKVQSFADGVSVPSCVKEQLIKHATFSEKLAGILTEMSTL